MLVAALAAVYGAASAAPRDGIGPTEVEAPIAAKLVNVPTYIPNSAKDLLTAAVGSDSSVCAVQGSRISDARCAELARREILRRAPVKDLLRAVEGAKLGDGKGARAFDLLEKIGGPEVDSGLASLSGHFDGSFANYLALTHLASKCDARSLQILNAHWWGFEIPSYVWAEAIELFGRCHYLPATNNLVDALDAASGNAVDAAAYSLRLIYPAGPQAAGSLAAVGSWRSWLAAHGSP